MLAYIKQLRIYASKIKPIRPSIDYLMVFIIVFRQIVDSVEQITSAEQVTEYVKMFK